MAEKFPLPKPKVPKFPPDINEWLPGEPIAEPPLPLWMIGKRRMSREEIKELGVEASIAELISKGDYEKAKEVGEVIRKAREEIEKLRESE